MARDPNSPKKTNKISDVYSDIVHLMDTDGAPLCKVSGKVKTTNDLDGCTCRSCKKRAAR